MIRLRLILVPVGALAASGCASRNPLAAWQARVTDYVVRQGHGDPNVLRDLVDMQPRNGLRPGRMTIGELGISSTGPTPRAGTRDVQGVVLGGRTVQSRRWFLFLVGVIARTNNSRTDLEDLRVAAFSAERDAVHWIVTPPDAEALQAYLTAAKTNVAAAGREQPNSTFPGPFDAYRLEAAGNVMTVTEEHSGATWTLQLQAPEATLASETSPQRETAH